MPIRHTFPKANTGLNLLGLFFALLASARLIHLGPLTVLLLLAKTL